VERSHLSLNSAFASYGLDVQFVRIQSDAAINRRRLRRGGPCAEGWRKDGLDYSVAGGAVAADGSMEPRIPAAACEG